MESKILPFTEKYRACLHTFVLGGSDLEPARALGQKALAAGMEMLDVVKAHEKAVSIESQVNDPGLSPARLIKRAGLFFAQVITPIEATHRQAQEAAVRLNKLIQALDKRTKELATSNQELKAEVRRRAKIERALKKSERHYTILLEESELLQEQLRYVSRQILSAQEDERKRISRELHDQIAASLMGINIELSGLRNEATGNNRILRRKIARTQRLVQESVKVIHAFARDLRPAALDDLGLIPALHSFAKAFSKQTGIQVRLKIFAGVEELDNPKRTVLYRVTQEAMTNVLKHAKASQVQVNIGKRDGAVILSIHDDGKSFQVERLMYSRANKRLGLLGMRERVEMVGGNFRVQSARGKGTIVHASIPMENIRSNGGPVKTQAYGK
jgi:signal transduction histidine kinase